MRQPARKASNAFGGSVAKSPGRGLLTQHLSRPGAFVSVFDTAGAIGESPEAAAQSPDTNVWSTPMADQSTRQEEEFRTPGTLTQDEWNTMMQTGSAEQPVSSRKTSGTKKGVRPAMKKQRLGAGFPG